MIKRFIHKLPIGQKIVALIVTVSMFSILIAIGGLSINEFREIDRRMTQEVTVISDVLATNITAAIVFDDKDAAQELLNALKAKIAVEYARVESADKVLFAHYGKENLANKDTVNEMSYYTIETPLYVNQRRVGNLILVFNNAQMSESIRVYLTVVVAVIFISLVFSFLLSVWVQRRFAAPIIELAAMAEDITKTGDYTIRTTAKTSGEIKLLQDLFNDMLAKTNDRELALEALVSKRTQELETLNKQLENQAHYDSLTMLPNRALYEDRLQQSIAHAARDGSRVALFFIDLDKFKIVNDTLGHAAGDELLCQVSRRLEKQCRQMDTVARIGGDEFTMLFMLDDELNDVNEIARRIVELFQIPFDIMDEPLLMTMSVGVSIYPTHGYDFDVLKVKADNAMYQAKQAGRNQFLISQT